MSDNLRHWSVLSRTDPAHTKPFQRAGGFRGTATRPIWNEMRLTEHFGPCGEGWGSNLPTFTLVPALDEILVFCTLECWYKDAESERRFIWGVGGDKVLVKDRNGLRTDDEAYKKAFTDALGNAFKHVGMNADIHMGLFEDSKYRDEVAREFADDRATPAPATDSAGQSRQASTPDAVVANGATAAETRDLLLTAINDAQTPAAIDRIIAINGVSLALVKQAGPKTYEKLMAVAAARKSELYGGA